MALEAQLEALTVPEGTEFPGTVQGLMDMIAQYEAIVGLEDFNGINYGPTEPSEDNRDKPWFKTDSSLNPVGWFGWNGLIWAPIPVAVPYGPTISRPTSPSTGTQYFDTDINVTIIFERSQWRTLGGSPGDVKNVIAATPAQALARNPGWEFYTDAVGRVIAGANSDGSNYGVFTGATEITLTEGQLPPHVHTTQGNYGSGGEGGADNPLYYDAAQAPVSLQTWPVTGSTGDGDPVSVMQPTLYLYVLYKV